LSEYEVIAFHFLSSESSLVISKLVRSGICPQSKEASEAALVVEVDSTHTQQLL
jgi:hypothetical protein